MPIFFLALAMILAMDLFLVSLWAMLDAIDSKKKNK